MTVSKPDLSLLIFFDSFAASTGRYYNVSNLDSDLRKDPIEEWDSILKDIASKNISERQWKMVELNTAKIGNVLLQSGISYPPDYLDQVFADKVNEKSNHFEVLHIINLMKRLTETLDGISMSLCRKDTGADEDASNYPKMPY